MAKKSQKRRSRNKDQRGCISGLIDIFDFRQGQSTRKLLEDDRHANKKVLVSRGKSTTQKVISSDAENYDTVENAKTSVKKLMEEEMINEKGSQDPISNSKQGNCSKKSKDRGKNRSHDMTHCMDIISELDAGNEQTLSSNVHLEKLMEELAQFELGDLSTHVNENLTASVRRFLEQRMSKSKHFGEESKELMDAMEMLGSSKGLLSKLLQESTSLKSDENGKRQNIFRRRRSKSLGSCPSEMAKDDDNQSPNRIVVLKHRPAESDISEVDRLSNVDSKVIITRHASQFSFTEIKRRLRHAMGKDSSPSGKKSANQTERANLGWRSPNRNHFYTERFTLSSPMSSKRHSDEKGSVYAEATKHLSEMLKKGDESGEFLDVQLPKPLRTIISLPSYGSSPCCSPRNKVEDVSSNAHMRDVLANSLSSNVHENGVSSSSPSREDSDSKQRMADDQDCLLGAQSSEAEGITIHEVVAKIEDAIEANSQEDEIFVSISREWSICSVAGDLWNEDLNIEAATNCSEESSPCLDLSDGDQYLSSPATSQSIEKSDRPSPISILEPLFTDDEISPQSRIPSPVKRVIEPIHIHFDEQYQPINQAICNRISPEDEESAFEYVEAVLLGSGLDWDQFSLRWLSHQEILDPSLFDEVELFSSQSRHDQKLLFDCANEALEEICQICFRFLPGIIPCLKYTNQRTPRDMDLISNVWDRVETTLTSNPQHLSLDQHVRRDLKGSGKWMELRSYAELIGEKTEEVIFDELVEDVVLSFKDDRLPLFDKSEL